MKRILFICLITAVVLSVSCSTSNTSNIPDTSDYVFNYDFGEAIDSPLPFSRGVNFSAWFEVPSPRSIPFTKYSEQDFIDAKSIGVDVIRLPIHMHNMAGGAPGYILDPLFLSFLDQAVDWAEQYQLYVILDNHSFHPVDPTAPNIDKVLIPVWTQIAQRYKDRSDYIVYEILNEPHGINAKLWGEIQGKVIDAIRTVDTQHYIIVGGIEYNSINALSRLPTYDDDKIIYTFHFYDPYLFTHQGETWGSPPNLATLRDMPFPGDAHKIPPIPRDLRGTWIENSVNQSYRRDATIETLAQQLDKAVAFSQERGNVPLFCGEFGVFVINSLNEDRVRWYQAVTKLLDARGIARTSWDYFGGFGIFKTGNSYSFESDLNVDVVTALGFTAPPQKPSEKIRDAFTVFDSYPSTLMSVSHYGGDVDMYYQNGDKYVISWGNVNQYGTIFFNFRRGIDWEYLQSNDYAITFMVKTDKPARFDVRFVESEEDSNIPWRINTTVDIDADGQWHTVRIPLSSMWEQGGWVNATRTWHPAEGKFSWDNVIFLAFVAEERDLHGITVQLDTIVIEPPQDQAQIADIDSFDVDS